MRLLQTLIAISALGLPAPVSAQNLPAPCLDPSPYSITVLKDVLEETRKEVPLGEVALCRSYQVPNAYAIPVPVYQLNPWGQPVALLGFQHFMYYNPLFMGQLDVSRNNKWAQYGVFAHEVGHFVDAEAQASQAMSQPMAMAFSFDSPWSKELFADRHAGRILARMGATAQDVEEAQRFMFTLHGSPTHPDTVSRLGALYEGYAGGGGDVSQLPSPDAIAQGIFEQVSRW